MGKWPLFGAMCLVSKLVIMVLLCCRQRLQLFRQLRKVKPKSQSEVLLTIGKSMRVLTTDLLWLRTPRNLDFTWSGLAFANKTGKTWRV
jgi:hypothetical protein